MARKAKILNPDDLEVENWRRERERDDLMGIHGGSPFVNPCCSSSSSK